MKFLKLWVPVIVWMGIIFFFSSRESVQVSEQQWLNFLFFKALHIIEYFILYILCFRATLISRRQSFLKYPYITASVISISYAIVDEVHQLFVPTREGKLRDVIIDAIGVSLAWLFLSRVVPKMPQKLRLWVKSLGLRT